MIVTQIIDPWNISPGHNSAYVVLIAADLWPLDIYRSGGFVPIDNETRISVGIVNYVCETGGRGEGLLFNACFLLLVKVSS